MISSQLLIVFYLLISVLSLYVYNTSLQLFFERKNEQKIGYRIVAVMIYLGFGTGTCFWGIAPIVNFLVNIFIMLMVANCYYGKLSRKLIFIMLWHCFVVVVELFAGVILGLVVGTSIDSIITNDISQMAGNILCRVIELVSVKILQECKRKRENIERMIYFNSLQVIFIPILSILLICILFYISNTYTGVIQWLIGIALVCLTVMNLFVSYLFDKLRITEEMKYQNRMLQTHTAYYIEQENSLYEAQEKIRVVRHDLKHHLLYVKAKLEENTEEALQELNHKVTQLVGSLPADNMQIYTRNQKINRLLNYKLSGAQKKGVELKVQVCIRENVDIEEESLHIILGNAIDNAIENYNPSEARQKELIIKILEDNDNLFIHIANPYVGDIKFKNELPITKKKDKTIHGIGLRNVKKIVNDKKGHIKITTIDHIFSLEVILYNEIKEL